MQINNVYSIIIITFCTNKHHNAQVAKFEQGLKFKTALKWLIICNVIILGKF